MDGGVKFHIGTKHGPGPDDDLAGGGDERDHLGFAATDEARVEVAQEVRTLVKIS